MTFAAANGNSIPSSVVARYMYWNTVYAIAREISQWDDPHMQSTLTIWQSARALSVAAMNASQSKRE